LYGRRGAKFAIVLGPRGAAPGDQKPYTPSLDRAVARHKNTVTKPLQSPDGYSAATQIGEEFTDDNFSRHSLVIGNEQLIVEYTECNRHNWPKAMQWDQEATAQSRPGAGDSGPQGGSWENGRTSGNIFSSRWTGLPGFLFAGCAYPGDNLCCSSFRLSFRGRFTSDQTFPDSNKQNGRCRVGWKRRQSVRLVHRSVVLTAARKKLFPRYRRVFKY
jgi:hypothetical protein